MKKHHLASVAYAMGACAVASPAAGAATAPTYKVLDGTLDKSPMAKLVANLGLPGVKLDADNVLDYLSKDYLDLPMKPVQAQPGDPPEEDEQDTVGQAFDYAAMQKIKPVTKSAAVAGFRKGLKAAGALPAGSRIKAEYTHFGVTSPEGQQYFDLKIQTHVANDLSLNGKPYVGPGAQVEASVDPKGVLSSLTYALREVKKAGSATLIEAQDAIAEVQQRFARSCDMPAPSAFNLNAALVYFAPDMGLKSVKKIVPHYEVSGTITVSGQTLDVRKTIVPAIEDAPEVGLDATSDGSRVTATADVAGGTAPYTYEWQTCTADVQAADDGTLSYTATTKEGGPAEEIVSVIATDANGLVSHAAVPLDLQDTEVAQAAGRRATAQAADLSRVDVGVEFMGVSQGLPGSSPNGWGYANSWSAGGVPYEFVWGDGNAWESDFKSPTDDYVVDNVDAVFYSGHANDNGWTIGSGDGFVDYNETRYGNRDLEWLTIAACGPLQGVQTGALSRWFNTFQGLHILQGYATVTYDTTTEGRDLANYLKAGWRHRDAWAQTARNAQGPNEIWAQMGLIHKDGRNNYDDHFWGRGAVGPDIPLSSANAYWYLWGTS